MLIIPSVLTDNLEEAAKIINDLNDVVLSHGFPLERVQIDINDGTFLGVKTIEPQTLSEINSDLKFDYHLMVDSPTKWVRKCVHADRVIGEIEKMSNQEDFIFEAKSFGTKIGLALDFSTDLDQLRDDFLSELDVVLLMSYPAGVGGQELRSEVFGKIDQLKELKSKVGADFKICLDGGVTLDNINRVKQSEVDEVVVGERIVGGDIEENLEKFYKAMY